MTEDNRRRNIAEEIERAEQSLRAADALCDLALHADSVSRAYYALFHWLRALLMSRGIEPKSHRSAIHLFNREFVRTGIVGSEHNRVIGGLQRARELADYDAAVSFSAEDAQQLIADARSFAETAHDILQREGWIR